MTPSELDMLAGNVCSYLISDPVFQKLVMESLDDYFFRSADQNLKHYLQTHRDYLASLGLQVSEPGQDAPCGVSGTF